MIGFAAQRLMKLEVNSVTCASYGGCLDRQVQRNGYRDRDWETRTGFAGLEKKLLRHVQHIVPYLAKKYLGLAKRGSERL